MKISLEEDVPHPLARQLSGHQVSTVAGVGWGGVKNGQLLLLLAAEGFEVLITGDKNLQHQRAVQECPFAAVLLSTIHWPALRKHSPPVVEAVVSATPGTPTPVQCGSISPRRRGRD